MTVTNLLEAANACMQHNGPYTLSSGNASDYYFDKYQLLTSGWVEDIARIMGARVPSSSDHVAGPVLGGALLAQSICNFVGIPNLIAHNEPKKYGMKKQVEGTYIAAGEVCLVDDVLSSGGSLINMAKNLRALGFTVKHAVVLLNRNQDGKYNLYKNGIQTTSIMHVASPIGGKPFINTTVGLQ